MADVQKVELVAPSTQPELSKEEHKAQKENADNLFDPEKARAHAPVNQGEERRDWQPGAPPAQGPNISKEEAEFAANAEANSKAEDVPEEKQANPAGASEPLAEAGKAPKKKK